MRRIIGYDRYEGNDVWHTLADLYAVLRQYVNYFQPSLKLLSKKRDGSKTTKKYDQAKTPFQRIENSSFISDDVKVRMRSEYETLDPVDLLKRLKDLQNKFWQHAVNVVIPEVNETIENSKKLEQIDELIEASQVECNISEVLTDVLNGNDHIEKQYRKSKKARKKQPVRTWKTRKDIFESVWDSLRQQLELNPYTTARMLLDDLVKSKPKNLTTSTLEPSSVAFVTGEMSKLTWKRMSI